MSGEESPSARGSFSVRRTAGSLSSSSPRPSSACSSGPSGAGVLHGEPLRAASADVREHAALWHFAAAFVLLGVAPAFVVHLVLRERMRDFGVRFGDVAPDSAPQRCSPRS